MDTRPRRERWRSAPWAWCSGTSAPARSTRSRSRCTPSHGLSPTPANVLGVLSLIFWSLTMVVTVKYLAFVMRADNRGEGGIFALFALLPQRAASGPGRWRERGAGAAGDRRAPPCSTATA